MLGERRWRRAFRAGAALAGSAAAVVLVTMAIAGGGNDGSELATASDSASGGSKTPPTDSPALTASVSIRQWVLKHEALPCTHTDEPINFEIFSAGPSVAGVPLTNFTRRCGGTTSADEPPPNFTNYLYGSCEVVEGAPGCALPLQIQTWPACQRALGDYSFEGKPIPYQELPKINGAEVVEINFMLDHRIEIYTGSSTIVIFAENRDLARKALSQLRSQKIGKPPATEPKELKGQPDGDLAAPSDGATEGALQCQT